MHLQFILVILAVTSGLSALMLAYISSQSRRIKGAGAFALLCSTVAIPAFFYALEIQFTLPGDVLLWGRMKYMVAVFMPVAWFAFAVRYTDRHEELRLIRYRHIAIASIIPVITSLLMLFNPGNLIWQTYVADYRSATLAVDVVYGQWMLFIYLPYALLLIFTGFWLFSRKWIQPDYRQPLMMVLAALLLPFIGTAIVFLYITILDPGALFFAISTIILAVGILRINVLDIRPAAYNHLLQNIPDGLLVADASDQIVMLNPAFLKYSHYNTEAEILGRKLHDVLDEEMAATQSLWDTNSDASFFKRGQQYENVMAPRLFPLRDERGYEIGYGMVFRDDATQRHAEVELQKRVDQLSILSQIDEEITHTLKIQPILEMALDAAMRLSHAEVGYIAVTVEEDIRVETVIGKFDKEMIGRSLRPSDGIVGSVLVEQEPKMILDIMKHEDKNPFRHASKAMMIIPLSAAERLMGLLVLETEKPERFDEEIFEFIQQIANRITVAIENASLYRYVQEQLDETQKLYAKVQQLEQLKTDMIRIAAHDLKNPLSVVEGYMEMMMLDQELLPEHVVDYVDSARHTAHRMRDMLMDILSLERIEQMAKDASKEELDLRETIETLTGTYRGQADEKQQQLNVHVHNGTAYGVEGDPAQIKEAVSNLIGNAIKYTPTGGSVDVYLDYDNAHHNNVVFKVVDTGYGIPLNQQPRIFQPFFRAKTVETSSIKGTGLGLHLVKNIIERHEGEMIFDSEYGHGSTFGFKLPSHSVKS
ncbi:MAG: histidine kinase N-terminal 7TM domain-containing protein [Aggregatilineales bacterium]